ncbi:Type I phosphodiesterase / nucleotide pyrophosphatase [bacterium A37T11]|nr:Type I phosphodiesterase / nucleotide pyrophosphatase [bacterium A37T11]
MAQEQPSKPKLVVGIVVDQMRWDYLYRYQDRYSENGFKRLLRDGFSCENTYINYIPSYTAIGHSSIYTGSVPAIHGITGNDFILEQTGQPLYCTEDKSVKGVGTDGAAGEQSPKNLLASTITDQVRLSTNFRSKVIGVALKDRGSILPAGHFANAAYWYDSKSGRFISSTFYLKELPKWVQDFNAQNRAEKLLSQDWNTLYPINTYKQSINDDNVYEGMFNGEKSTAFPHKTAEIMKRSGLGLISSTPYGNTLTKEMAIAAIENEHLGANPEKVTDFLTVSFSATDYVGHHFAINSVEVEDTYLRLDKDLGELLSYLDTKVGKGQYTVFLTADHGAAHNPQFFKDQRGNGGFFGTGEVQKGLNQLIEQKFGVRDLVTSLNNYQVHFNPGKIDSLGAEKEAAIHEEIVRFLKKQDGVAFAVDLKDVGTASVPQRLREKIINGYNLKRSGPIQIILEPQWFSGSKTGTTHGTWNSYDAHIPCVWMGWGIKHGSTNRETHMTDIAPTVAALLQIEEPNGNIGVPIGEVLGR